MDTPPPKGLTRARGAGSRNLSVPPCGKPSDHNFTVEILKKGWMEKIEECGLEGGKRSPVDDNSKQASKGEK